MSTPLGVYTPGGLHLGRSTPLGVYILGSTPLGVYTLHHVVANPAPKTVARLLTTCVPTTRGEHTRGNHDICPQTLGNKRMGLTTFVPIAWEQTHGTHDICSHFDWGTNYTLTATDPKQRDL